MKKFIAQVFATIVGIFIVGFIFFGLILVLGISSLSYAFTNKVLAKNNAVLELNFDAAVMENGMEETVSWKNLTIKKDTSIYFSDILAALEKAKTDKNIKGISLKLSEPEMGITQLTDIRNALLDFKKSGKFIYAYSNNLNQKGYYLATVADSLYQNHMGNIEFKGLSSEIMFYKSFADKYGVNFEVIRHGKYKSAVEPFLRTDLSSENKEQLSALLNDVWTNITTDISVSRKLPIQRLNTIADSLYGYIPENALKANMVDRLIQESDYTKIIKKKLGVEKDEDLNTIDLDSYAQTVDTKNTNKNKIAVLYAVGEITAGSGNSGIQSEIYKETIQDLASDDDVKAVVLRINSPGGDANASEELLYELNLLKAKKPLVVSFGDVAASGGYYIAMAANKIFASPTTITGSIGVFGMMPNGKKIANSLGVTTDYATTNKNAVFFTPLNGLTPDAKITMTNSVESIYQKFVNHVALSRHKTFAQIDSIGGGRVWSGKRALEIGLIDQFGTLNDAIKEAAKEAKITNYSLENTPEKEIGIKDYLMSMASGVSTSFINQKIENELGKEYYAVYNQLIAIKNKSKIQMALPYSFKINF